MSSASKHLRRARRHLDTANKWGSDESSLGWAAVVLFYAARDLIHAVFDADETLPGVCKHPDSHSNIDLAKPGTNTVLKRHYRTVETYYMNLYATSLGVRYEGQTVSEATLADLQKDFQELCRWADRELRTAQRTPPDWMKGT